MKGFFFYGAAFMEYTQLARSQAKASLRAKGKMGKRGKWGKRNSCTISYLL